MADCDKVFDLYKEMLELHIGTKTNDIVFHQASKWFYETLFSAFHDAKEVLQDSKQESPVNAEDARKKSYKLLEEAKGILTSMVESNKDIAVDNVLRWLVDKLGFDCGTARGFCGCDKASEAESNQEPSEKEEPAKSEDEEQESKDDASSYGMEVEVVEVKDADDDEDEAETDEDIKKKEEEEKKNKEMW